MIKAGPVKQSGEKRTGQIVIPAIFSSDIFGHPVCRSQVPGSHICSVNPARSDGIGLFSSDTGLPWKFCMMRILSLIHISEPTRLGMISYAVFCLKKKKQKN